MTPWPVPTDVRPRCHRPSAGVRPRRRPSARRDAARRGRLLHRRRPLGPLGQALPGHAPGDVAYRARRDAEFAGYVRAFPAGCAHSADLPDVGRSELRVAVDRAGHSSPLHPFARSPVFGLRLDGLQAGLAVGRIAGERCGHSRMVSHDVHPRKLSGAGSRVARGTNRRRPVRGTIRTMDVRIARALDDSSRPDLPHFAVPAAEIWRASLPSPMTTRLPSTIFLPSGRTRTSPVEATSAVKSISFLRPTR